MQRHIFTAEQTHLQYNETIKLFRFSTNQNNKLSTYYNIDSCSRIKQHVAQLQKYFKFIYV